MQQSAARFLARRFVIASEAKQSQAVFIIPVCAPSWAQTGNPAPCTALDSGFARRPAPRNDGY
jgi:hypothetical protein